MISYNLKILCDIIIIILHYIRLVNILEYVNEINLNEAIIHILDSNGEQPVLNEFPLVLVEETYEYILKHLQKCLRDEELKYALFNNERNIVKELAFEYFEGKSDLINISKEIANQLFVLMKSRGNIPSCDLMVVSITTEFGPMIAILKMDYVKNYTHNIDFIDNKIGINIIPQFIGLPSSGQRIQKCAFIKPLKEDNKFDLMVIDKQNKSKDDDYGSNYFISNFLGCTIIDNERDMTRNFIKVAEKWTRNNLKDNADAQEAVRSSIKKSLKSEEEIDIKALSKNMFSDDKEASEKFVQYIKEQGLSENLSVDKAWVDNKLKMVRLKIDKDIDIYIDHETYDDASRFEIVRNGDGTINLHIKHVRNYIEKN